MHDGDAPDPLLERCQRQLDELRRLAEADAPRPLANAIVRVAMQDPDCRHAVVLWDLGGSAAECEPAPLPDAAALALVRAVAAKSAPVFKVEDALVALRLSDTPAAVLLVQIEGVAARHRFIEDAAKWLETAGRHMARVLEIAELRASLRRAGRAERLQHALFAISDLAGSDRDMPEMLRGIQAIIGSLMYAENFFIVAYSAERDTMRFLYFVDTEDVATPSRDPRQEFPMSERVGSLTWYVLHDRKSLMGSTPQLQAQISGPLVMIGPDSYDWLGVPMLRDGHVHGALVVQSYLEGVGYSAEDRALLEFVAEHVLTALERKQGKEELEAHVRERTAELAQANRELQQEIVERKRGEHLQKALFQIAQLATADIDLAEFCQRVHAEVGGLMNASNFYIALVSEDGAHLEFPYFFEEELRQYPSRPLGLGLSEYVINRGQPLFASDAQIHELAAQGAVELHVAGRRSMRWLGVPLQGEQGAIGVLVVQAYDDVVQYGPAEQDLLGFVAIQVGNSLRRRRAAEALRQANAQLERRVGERTRALTDTLDQLREAQGELVRQEKMASLGGLVAGIAHEINTPLGICVTAASYVRGELNHWRQDLAAGKLDARALEGMFEELDTTMQVLDSNSRRGAELVRSFKQIAVDQSSGQFREFDLAEYLDEILLSLKPKLKRAPFTVQVDCPHDIHMHSFPGALSQVVTNLVMNTLMHAFEGRQQGLVRITAALEDEQIALSVADDGIGMSQADLKRFFDPFFTTKRGSGGTGLGANIVFNQVTNVLGGSIRADSTPGQGTTVSMRLPRVLEGKRAV